MHILNTSSSLQSITLLPRRYPSEVDVTITDANTNESNSFVSTPTVNNTYMAIQAIFSLGESTFHILEVRIKDEDTLIYRGQIFCTDQTDLNNFDMSKGDTKTGYDNDNIILI